MDWRPLVEGRIANFGIVLDVFEFSRSGWFFPFVKKNWVLGYSWSTLLSVERCFVSRMRDFWVLSQFEFLSFVTIWVFEFCYSLIFWVIFFSFVTIGVYDVCYNLRFWFLTQFVFLSFLIIWFFEFCNKLSFWVLSQFEFLSVVTIIRSFF